MDTPSRKIRVVFAINDFIIGGAQKLIVDLLTHIDRTQFEPELITLFKFDENERKYLYDSLPPGVSVHKLRFKGFFDLSAWKTLVRTLRINDPDIIISNLFFSNAIFRILSPFFRYRIFIVEHNTYTEKTKTHQLLDHFLARVTERIIAVSKTVAVFTAAQERISPSKFIVIHNGIDLEKLESEVREADPAETRSELGISPEDHVIINVARVVPQKNHQLLLDGFALFADGHPHYRLIIVGGGGLLEKMGRYAETLGLGNRVQFLGSRRDISRILGISDFFVSTSLIEGFGIAHAEALACGVPVLTTKTAGPDEMVQEGVNGFFISAYTKEAVADGLIRMAEQNLAPLRVAARRSSREYSIERAVRAYENLFRQSVGQVREVE